MQPIKDKQVRMMSTPEVKVLASADYNYIFRRKDGFFARWGKTKEDDPQWSPHGPEILDLEISVNGCPNACRFCYKSNNNSPATNMSFETFKKILDKMPETLTQIAFGITGIQTNPDFFRMMEYAREQGIVPNFTLSGIDLNEQLADRAAELVGAVAVSAYQQDKRVCYDTVRMFTDRGLDQTNIHIMVSQETLPFVYEVLNDRLTDPRLANMNAIVFLGVKPKGRAAGRYSTLTTEQYKDLVTYAMEHKINIGFDSCSAPKFEAAVHEMDLPDDTKQHFLQCSESCESSLFSAYINVKGEYWNCSFSEDEEPWKGVNVLECDDFIEEVWKSEAVSKFRKAVLCTECNGCRKCVTFPEINP